MGSKLDPGLRRGRLAALAFAFAALAAAGHAAKARGVERAALAASLDAGGGMPGYPAPSPPATCAAPAPAARGNPPDPFAITLYATQHAPGASGSVQLRFGASPFGLTVTQDGHHLYDAAIRTAGLGGAARGATLVAWAATPDLERVEKLGALDAGGALAARVHLNKFLVFITAEESAAVERWSGPILLRGVSPSGRMHTMQGHGPFAGEPCGTWKPF